MLLIAGRSHAPNWTKPVAMPAATQQHASGGVVRVVVATPPEASDTGEGGNTLRSLTTPRLFNAQPDGKWQASLVKPGTDYTTRDGRMATFVLRDATWSDGHAITVDDLRRTQDNRFVDHVDDPDAHGTVRVHLKQKLPGWRRLWSDAGIPAPHADVSGGPFIVSSVISGNETVLHRNAKWWGGAPAFLDEIRLQYVPDSTTARQLLEHGDVDVVAPAAGTARTQHFQAINGIKVDQRSSGGRWTALLFNTNNVPESTRTSAAALFPRATFINSLLANEATPYVDALNNAKTWRNEPFAVPQNLNGVGLTFSVPVENPLSTEFDRSLSLALSGSGAKMRSQATDAAAVDRLVAAKTYDVALVTEHDGPDVCWQCRFGDVDMALAKRADAGDPDAARHLEQRVRDGGVMLPLWRERPLVAFRPQAVDGVTANGYVTSLAWLAENWWKP